MAAEPVAGRMVGRRINEKGHRDDYNEDLEHIQRYEVNDNPQKTNAVTTVQKDNMIAEPVRIGTIESDNGTTNTTCQSSRVYSSEGKSITLKANGGGGGAKTGLYACPVPIKDDGNGKSRTIKAQYHKNSAANAFYTSTYGATLVIENADGTKKPIYEVMDGYITIKDKRYPIKLADGYYIIRKLTVTECCRLQTMPDDYCRAVSASQAYKGLGNGWTAEVIIHILKHMNIPLDEEIEVLSMYDGIGTGRYCFDKMGYKNVRYHAYEIDKYAMQMSMSNYPDIIQCGDAFQVRSDDWQLG
jgi:DNA (cytosine-5)-methyltransferase 3A